MVAKSVAPFAFSPAFEAASPAFRPPVERGRERRDADYVLVAVDYVLVAVAVTLGEPVAPA